MSSQAVLSVEAQRKTTRAVKSVLCSVIASSTRTPVAPLAVRSYSTSVAMAYGRA
jgi:hypothetical protein